MKNIFLGNRDDIVQRIIKNAGIVLSGNIAASLLNIISFTIVANQLGPKALGFLVLAQTYSAVINDIFNVQTWESMVMYGSKTLRDSKFSSVIKTNLAIDILSAVVAFIFAVSLAKWIVGLLNWDSEIASIATLYSFVILTRITSFTIGIPRLFDKFAKISVFQVSTAAFKLALVLAAVYTNQGLIGYIYIYMISEVLLNLILIIFSLKVLSTEHHSEWWKEKLVFNREQLKFIWWTNLRTIVRIPVRHLDMVVIGTVISLEMVGIYKVYKEIASTVKRIQDPINQTIFPEFTKLLAKKEKQETARVAKKTIFLLSTISSIIIGVLLLTAGLIVEKFFGAEYLIQIHALHALLIVYLLSFITVPINSLFIASGFAKSSVYILLFTNSMYLASAYYFGLLYGIYGIVIAYTVQLVSNKGLKIYLLYKHPDWGERIR